MRWSLLEIRAFFAGRRLDLSFTIAAAAIAVAAYALIGWFNATAPAEQAPAASAAHAALFLIIFTGALLAPKWRYLAAAAGALTLPRFSALLFDLPATRTLWPLFLGLAAALALHSALARRAPDADAAAAHAGLRTDRALVAALVALAACAWVTATDLFSPWIFTGYPLAPYELAPEIHAPLAMHAALTPLVNLGAPALFVLADGAYRARIPDAAVSHAVRTSQEADSTTRIVRDLTGGAALALVLALPAYALQIAGVSRAFAGVLDASVAAARMPGLFSDSGAAAALAAAQLTLAWLHLDLSPWLAARRRLRATLRIALAALAVAFALWQGRLFPLALAWCLALAAVALYGGPRRLLQILRAHQRRLPWLAAGALLVILLGGVFLNLRLTPTLARLDATLDAFAARLLQDGPGAALAGIDPVRAALNIQALQLWSERPWTGIGLNQFPIELAYRQSLPGAPPVAIDNPPNLGFAVLLDGGIPAAAIALCLALVWYLRLRRPTPPPMEVDASAHNRFAAEARIVRAVQWAPLWLLPASLVGYQILHPEFAALGLIFWMLAPAPHAGERREAAAAPAILFFTGIYVGAALGGLFPAPRPPFWKAERLGGTPQLAPDLAISAGAGPALLFFYREREFALKQGGTQRAGSGSFDIVLPAEFLERGARVYGACPGGAVGAHQDDRPLALRAAAGSDMVADAGVDAGANSGMDASAARSAETREFLAAYRLARYRVELPDAAACGATLRLRVAGDLPKARRVFGLSADAFETGRLGLVHSVLYKE